MNIHPTCLVVDFIDNVVATPLLYVWLFLLRLKLRDKERRIKSMIGYCPVGGGWGGEGSDEIHAIDFGNDI